MTRRHNWSATEKMQIVTDLLHPEATVTEICRARGILGSQAYGWKRAALERVK